jgi:hypothetical protein
MCLAYNLKTSHSITRDQRKGGDLRANVSILRPRGGDFRLFGSSENFRRRWEDEDL